MNQRLRVISGYSDLQAQKKKEEITVLGVASGRLYLVLLGPLLLVLESGSTFFWGVSSMGSHRLLRFSLFSDEKTVESSVLLSNNKKKSKLLNNNNVRVNSGHHN